MRRKTSIKIDDVFQPEFQSRLIIHQNELKPLSESIKDIGLLNPILVRPFGNKYQLICGQRRLEACRLLGWTEIPAEVDNLSDDEALRIHFDENDLKVKLSPYELGRFVYQWCRKKMLAEGHDQAARLIPPEYYERIAKILKVGVTTVKGWIRIYLKFPAKFREFIEPGSGRHQDDFNTLSYSAASELVSVSDHFSGDFCTERIIEEYVANPIGLTALRGLHRRVRHRKNVPLAEFAKLGEEAKGDIFVRVILTKSLYERMTKWATENKKTLEDAAMKLLSDAIRRL